MPEAVGPPREWVVGRYRPGDEREILDLINEVFGLRRSLEHWNWKFKDNPYGGPLLSLARLRSDGRLVGTYMCLPFQMNVAGNPVPASQTVDLVVHRDYRQQGMFESMARDSYELLASVGIRAVVAFPNPTAMSYPGFVRTLAWRPLCHPRRFTLRLDLERQLRGLVPIAWLGRAINAGFRSVISARHGLGDRTLKDPSRDGLTFTVVTEAPLACDRLWEICRTHQGLSVWKDARYFRWRYDRNPDHRFEYGCLTRGTELVAMTVAVERDGAVTLCELLVAGQDAALGARLVTEVSRHYFAKRVRSVSFFGHDSGYFRSVLADFSVSRTSENVLVGRSLGDESLDALIANPGEWTVTYGDADFV